MIVVADTSPLNYIILIGHVRVLQVLYTNVLVPPAVYAELSAPSAPPAVRGFIDSLPDWIEVRTPPVSSMALPVSLGAGETEAIVLAQTFSVRLLLIDERQGRRAAEHLGIPVTGTLGILQAAHRAGLLSLQDAVDQLRQTSFQASSDLYNAVIRDVYER